MGQSPFPPRNEKRQKAQIFVSYSRSDRLAVDQLVGDLRRNHYRLWMDVDEQGIEPGEDWRNELVKQMRDSEGVIACGSPDFLQSPFCQEEIAQAKREGKLIYPVLVRRFGKDDSFTQMGLDHLQFVDLTLGYEVGLKRLMRVLPRPRFPTKWIAQRIAAGVVLLTVIAAVFVGIIVATQIGTTDTPPTLTPISTPQLVGDLKVVVAPFMMDESLSANNKQQAERVIADFSRDLDTQLTGQAATAESTFSIGFLGPDEVPTVVIAEDADPQNAAIALATTYNFDIVIYGTIKQTADGLISVQPEYYIPPAGFPDALEMTGSQNFGKPIALASTGLSGAYQTSETLRGRGEALIYVIRGLSRFVVNEYGDALTFFEQAAETEGWEDNADREILNLLIGNTHLQLARQAITTCDQQTVLDELANADEQYQAAIEASGDSGDEISNARPYAGAAEAAMMRAVWLYTDPDFPCDPQLADFTTLEQAFTYAEQALDADNFLGLEKAQQAQVQFTQARALASLWQFSELDDSRAEGWLNDMNRAITRTLSAFEGDTSDPLLIQTAFEAYLLRGAMQFQSQGACDQSVVDDLNAALALEGIGADRRMFVYDTLAQCYENLAQPEDALNAYQQALNIAETLSDLEADRAYYGCVIDQLKAPEESAEATPCGF